MDYAFTLTEELARWAFEVHLQKKASPWSIAFTNPTAGPWKRLMASNEKGTIGEVHRFEREEDRPDLVIVSDEHELVIILEAKDCLLKLLDKKQLSKSVQVVNGLTKKLKSKGRNEFWGTRANYTYVCGLLWGAEKKTYPTELELLFSSYLPLINTEYCSNVLIGVESIKSSKHINLSFHVSNGHMHAGGIRGEELRNLFNF